MTSTAVDARRAQKVNRVDRNGYKYDRHGGGDRVEDDTN